MNPNGRPPGIYTNTTERILARGVRSSDGCLEWTGAMFRHGYGRTCWRTRSTYVHRWAWEHAHGPIPDGKFVLHLCNNRRCFEPTHLELGDQDRNMSYAADCGRSASGERNGCAKLDASQVAVIRGLDEHGLINRTKGKQYNLGAIQRQKLAALFGITGATLTDVLSGKSWKGVEASF